MDKLLTTKQAAELLGQSPSTLRGWKCARIGPPYIQVSARNVKYAVSDLQKFVDRRRFVPSVRDTEERHAPVQKRR